MIQLSLGKQSSEAGYHYAELLQHKKTFVLNDFYFGQLPTALVAYHLVARESKNVRQFLSSIHNNKIYHLLVAIFVPSTKPRALHVLILEVVL